MKRKFKWINKNFVLGGLFFSMFAGVVVVNEMGILRDLQTTQVVLANDELPVNSTIGENDISIERYPLELYTPDMITDPNQVIGKMTTTQVDKKGFFTSRMLDQSILRPSENHEFFLIPNAWIVDDIQGSIRRYDLINVYAVIDRRNEVDDDEQQNQKPRQLVKKEKILIDVPVVYVKNSKNNEIIDQNGQRLHPNTNPSKIELSLLPQEYKQLEELFLEGYKFTFSY
ncbi:SAF domain-containing protein [Bacillus sp. SM2101]|uniref:flagella basal body P-ring formation protein FlgA n=1 Tax=Bacillus sp. SM2101 TaxID=2805366 RepID=UPI001BDE1F53|nr:SAF domain-containing protein [Bacillus sp. SM2101]